MPFRGTRGTSNARLDRGDGRVGQGSIGRATCLHRVPWGCTEILCKLTLCRNPVLLNLNYLKIYLFQSKAHINEAADCDDFFTTGEPVTTTNGTVTFDRHFGPSKSDNYSNLTSFAVFQLFAGEPAEETLILTGTVLVKDVLEKDKNGKEATFEQIVPPKPRAVLNFKVQFNAAFGCLLASPALMVVTLLVVALWSHQ